MKLIVDIPDEMYDWFDNGFPTEDDYIMLWKEIRQGTPLEEEGYITTIERRKKNMPCYPFD